MNVRRYSKHHIAISQKLYISKIKEKYGLGDKTPHTPSIKDHAVTQDLGDSATATEARAKRYRSLLGALLYCTLTRPDLAVTLSDLATVKRPTKAHEKLLRRSGDYVVSTPDLETHFRPRNDMRGHELVGYGDASFDTDPDTSRSRAGLVITFCGCVVMRKAKYQPFVALSVAEAEYAAMNSVCVEVVWLRRVLADIGFAQRSATPMYCDNTAAITLAKNSIATRTRTKHILRRLHYIREQVLAGKVKLLKILGTENPADFFTKVLSKPQFLKWREYFIR